MVMPPTLLVMMLTLTLILLFHCDDCLLHISPMTQTARIMRLGRL